MGRVDAVGLCLALVLQQVWAPPVVTTTNPNYIGPALGPVGDSPYQGKDHVFHLGAQRTRALSASVNVCMFVCVYTLLLSALLLCCCGLRAAKFRMQQF